MVRTLLVWLVAQGGSATTCTRVYEAAPARHSTMCCVMLQASVQGNVSEHNMGVMLIVPSQLHVQCRPVCCLCLLAFAAQIKPSYISCHAFGQVVQNIPGVGLLFTLCCRACSKTCVYVCVIRISTVNFRQDMNCLKTPATELTCYSCIEWCMRRTTYTMKLAVTCHMCASLSQTSQHPAGSGAMRFQLE